MYDDIVLAELPYLFHKGTSLERVPHFPYTYDIFAGLECYMNKSSMQWSDFSYVSKQVLNEYCSVFTKQDSEMTYYSSRCSQQGAVKCLLAPWIKRK